MNIRIVGLVSTGESDGTASSIDGRPLYLAKLGEPPKASCGPSRLPGLTKGLGRGAAPLDGVLLSMRFSRTTFFIVEVVFCEAEAVRRCGALLAESEGPTSESLLRRDEGARGCEMDAAAALRVLWTPFRVISCLDISGAVALLLFVESIECAGYIVVQGWVEIRCARRDCLGSAVWQSCVDLTSLLLF